MFTIDFDRSSLKMTERIWNMTHGLLKKILENAGVDEGNWVLKAPHRVRKKGPERFKALRIDYNGKAQGIRIRCKPQGNETSFEYTLIPPQEIEIENLFNLLMRVNPKTLEIYETLALKAAIEYPEIRGINVVPFWTKKNISRPNDHQKHSQPDEDVCNESPSDASKEVAVAEVSSTPEAPSIDLNYSKGEISKETSVSIEKIDNSIEKISKLKLIEDFVLSDPEVLDRALVSISFVSQDGYAPRIDASNSIIKNLDLNNFIKSISNGKYSSIEGAMRSIIMALRKNNYIERVHYSTGGDGVKGYKLTYRGEKRICALKKFLDNNIILQMNTNWGKFSIEEKQNKDQVEEKPDEEIDEMQEIEAEDLPKEDSTNEDFENYSKLESLIASIKEADEQIVEAEGFIKNLNSEKDDFSVELLGLNKAMEEQIRQKEEIDKRIAKIKEKKEEIQNKIDQKEKEIEDWRSYQIPYIEDKNKLKKEIEKTASVVGIGIKS